MIKMTNEELLQIAYKAMENAYAPYSEFKVGAALLTKDGQIYTGCNVENISYGATVCAERVAILKAVSEGQRSFAKLAIVSVNKEKTYPCGICRQVIDEFMPDGEIIVADNKDVEVYKADTLIPYGFHNKF